MNKEDSGIQGARGNGLEATAGIKLNGQVVVQFEQENEENNSSNSD